MEWNAWQYEIEMPLHEIEILLVLSEDTAVSGKADFINLLMEMFTLLPVCRNPTSWVRKCDAG